MTINDRIRAIIDALGLNNRTFAQAIGIDPAVMHNIASEKGRQSKPSFDVLEKILLSFDNLSSDYLMKGEGSIFRQAKSDHKGGQVILGKGGQVRGQVTPEEENEMHIKAEEKRVELLAKEIAAIYGTGERKAVHNKDIKAVRWKGNEPQGDIWSHIAQMGRHQQYIIDKLQDEVKELQAYIRESNQHHEKNSH